MLAGVASALVLAAVFPVVGVVWYAIVKRRRPASVVEAYVAGGGVLFLALMAFLVGAFLYSQTFRPLPKQSAAEPRWPDISYRGQ